MAKNTRTPDKASTAATTLREFVVDRDARFARIAADDVFVLSRRDDLLLSVIEQGPRPVRVRPPQDADIAGAVGRGQLGLEQGYTEVARLVVNPQAAITMAFQVVEQSLSRGWVEPLEVRALLDDVLGRFTAGDGEEVNK